MAACAGICIIRLIHIIQVQLAVGRLNGFFGNQAGFRRKLKHFAQDVLPVGFEDGPASYQNNVKITRKEGPQMAIGLTQPTSGAVALIGAEMDFLAGDHTEAVRSIFSRSKPKHHVSADPLAVLGKSLRKKEGMGESLFSA